MPRRTVPMARAATLTRKTEIRSTPLRGDAKGWMSGPRRSGQVGGRQQPGELDPVPPPVERGNRSLLRSRPVPRRTQLRQVSAKRRLELAQRRTAVAALLAERPWCEARLTGCQGRSVDAHELLRRSQGGDPTRPDLALCRACHDHVTTHPAEAVALGLAVWRCRGGAT